MRIAAVAAAALVPAIAMATPNTVGVGIGVSGGLGSDTSNTTDTLDLFGRIGLARRIGLQAEIARYEADATMDSNTRTFTLAVTYDLADTGHWIPMVLGGAGFDWGDTDFTSENGHHVEAGFALEYRSDDGLTLGADLRVGTRSITVPEVLENGPPIDGPAFGTGTTLAAGTYGRARVYAAIHF
jgi:hypothetical protein